jgi:hypothetical protein
MFHSPRARNGARAFFVQAVEKALLRRFASLFVTAAHDWHASFLGTRAPCALTFLNRLHDEPG